MRKPGQLRSLQRSKRLALRPNNEHACTSPPFHQSFIVVRSVVLVHVTKLSVRAKRGRIKPSELQTDLEGHNTYM